MAKEIVIKDFKKYIESIRTGVLIFLKDGLGESTDLLFTVGYGSFVDERGSLVSGLVAKIPDNGPGKKISILSRQDIFTFTSRILVTTEENSQYVPLFEFCGDCLTPLWFAPLH